MSTRSYIGFEHCTDRSVVASYCHFDGYLSHNGVLLHFFHASVTRALALVSGGSMWGLGRDCHWLPVEANLGLLPRTAETDRFPQADDDSNASVHASSVETMPLEEYNYVFSEKHGIWFVHCEETDGVWEPLEPVLARSADNWNKMTREFARPLEAAR